MSEFIPDVPYAMKVIDEAKLGSRKTQITNLLINGCSYTEIGEILNISKRTVESQVSTNQHGTKTLYDIAYECAKVPEGTKRNTPRLMLCLYEARIIGFVQFD